MDKTIKQFKRFKRGEYRYLLYALMGLLFLLISFGLVKNGQIGSVEQSIFRIFNDLPNILVNISLLVTQAGTLWFVLGVAIFIAFWRRMALVVEIVIAGIIAVLIGQLIKGFSIRLRPYELLNNVHIAGIKYTDMGFPSIHMATATALVVVLSARAGSGFKLAAWLVVVLVGLSRMILGMHAPLDIVGGFGVGLIAGSLVNYFAGIPKPRLSGLKLPGVKKHKQKLSPTKGLKNAQ